MEFILNIEDAPFVNNSGKKLYKSADFESLVFDKKGLDKLEKYNRPKHQAEKNELGKLRGQVDDLCNEVNRLASLECKSYGIGFQEGYDTGLKKLHDALKTVSAMTYEERISSFKTSSISDILTLHDPFEIIDIVAKFNSDKEKREDEFELWQEVEGNGTGIKAVIYRMTDDYLYVIYWNSTHTKLNSTYWSRDFCKPTGKVYTELLDFIEGK